MRYLPLSDADRADMLAAIGAGSVAELYRDVPTDVSQDPVADLPNHKTEWEVERAIAELAAKNLGARAAPMFIGAGAYRHFIPAAVDHLIQRGEFLTSYTPYQPEVSQGTLQAMYEFQTQVALITGMEVANASMYDGATACAEAAMMACRVTRRRKVVLAGGLHPHYRDVTQTNARFLDLDIVAGEPDPMAGTEVTAPVDGETACVIVQTPDVFGTPHEVSQLAETCHAAGALLVVVVTEAVSLGALKAPGDMGADIVAAEGQSLGNALSFGGPYVGLLAVREQHVRQMPGRLVGETVDVDGKRGWVLTLATREQHIRREKATSNICTNSGLCALAFTMHLTLLGETGFRKLAALNHGRAVALAEALAKVPGVEILNDHFFNEFTVRLAKPAAGVVDALAEKGVHGGVLGGVPATRLFPGRAELENLLVVAATETNSDDEIAAFATALGEVLP